MAGSTTEVLNEDIRILRNEVHAVDLDVRELSTKVEGLLTSIKLFAVFAVASLMGGIWWGATLSSPPSKRGPEFAKRSERLETKVDELGKRFDQVDTRFDRLEVSIARLIEQLKPAVKP